MTACFQGLFRTDSSVRDKFLARLFGIFSEEIVRCWCEDARSPYEDLGRPTVKPKGEQGRGSQLDFTLRSRKDPKEVYIAEMKCWLEYENYRYLPLKDPQQLRWKGDKAFELFLWGAKHPSQLTVTVNNESQSIDGSILVWSACSDEVRDSIVAEYGLRDVLSLEKIIAELVAQQNTGFLKLIEDRRTWAEYLFSGLMEVDRPCWP
ncbi:MAG TPA: hypothetical protein VKV05_07130 [Terriglobales bacterium]|nr:hypothetical protein [Terriglobales bacterium]